MDAATVSEAPKLTRAELDITSKVRSNLFPWRGQFSPQLVESHLRTYAPRAGAFIVDPFVGSGTVLVEALRLGHGAAGAEVNPAAAIMARTYALAALSRQRRAQIIESIDRCIAGLDVDDAAPLFTRTAPASIVDTLNSACRATRDTAERALLETLIVLLDIGNRPSTAPSLRSTWRNLRDLVRELPNARLPITASLADARSLPLADACADLVFTSPPYLNVFNYHQQYRPSVEALGWDVLPLARSEIGANRKHRGNRLLTVIQYCLDMTQVLVELSRVARPGARGILVIGRESNVRKTAFFNTSILKQLAASLSLSVLLEQERSFTNRFGQLIREDILHLKLRPCSMTKLEVLAPAREVARSELASARGRAPSDVLKDFDDVLSRIEEVEPSPLVAPETTFVQPS